ncbi:MAG: HPr family phosphocarrier protein [Alphaproteobacteria bacterium]|nr:HPr family phosphocarrier protein [Alphaproteobacteria bacterium]MBV8407412.1 HPr family phosphocarrier protein [Alphaproteobacteria bacterium]
MTTETPVIASALLINEVGLHARPAVKLTQLAKSFRAAVELALGPEGPWVDAKSPVRIMRVKAPKGAVLHFRASGGDADAAIGALVDLVGRGFDEAAGEGAGRA